MNRAHVSQSHRASNDLQRRLQSICFANVITSGERVRRVDAHAQWKFRTCIHNRAQMFEAMANTFTLSRGVLQQNPQSTKPQAFAGELKTERADFDRVCLAGTARTTRME